MFLASILLVFMMGMKKNKASSPAVANIIEDTTAVTEVVIDEGETSTTNLKKDPQDSVKHVVNLGPKKKK